jgi:hypothetical protein
LTSGRAGLTLVARGVSAEKEGLGTMWELIYDEVVEVAGFDPKRDVSEPWSLKAAMERLKLSDQSSMDAPDETWRLEDLLRRDQR